jgi:hypothetical protein
MVMSKLKNENSIQAMRWDKMHSRMCTQYITNIPRVCPNSFAQKCDIVPHVWGRNGGF